MKLNDEIHLWVSFSTVYLALNDPTIFEVCILHCEELTKNSDAELEAKVVLKIGPVKSRLAGEMALDTSGAPTLFSLKSSGNGWVAGFAKGGADMVLEDDN